MARPSGVGGPPGRADRSPTKSEPSRAIGASRARQLHSAGGSSPSSAHVALCVRERSTNELIPPPSFGFRYEQVPLRRPDSRSPRVSKAQCLPVPSSWSSRSALSRTSISPTGRSSLEGNLTTTHERSLLHLVLRPGRLLVVKLPGDRTATIGCPSLRMRARTRRWVATTSTSSAAPPPRSTAAADRSTNGTRPPARQEAVSFNPRRPQRHGLK
jgi:hypothetical protein